MSEDRVVSDVDTLGTLLVVEDSPGDRRLIEEAVDESTLDTTVHAVTTGEEALEFVDQRGAYADAPRPDVVLLDWSLPGMAGKEVLHELKANFATIPVVVMTGSKPLKEALESTASRADGYLTKPTEPDEYTEALRSLADVGTDPGT